MLVLCLPVFEYPVAVIHISSTFSCSTMLYPSLCLVHQGELLFSSYFYLCLFRSTLTRFIEPNTLFCIVRTCLTCRLFHLLIYYLTYLEDDVPQTWHISELEEVSMSVAQE